MNSKLFYSIQEASEHTGVAPHTIRYWEKKYNLLRPERDSRGKRRYKNTDLELIKKIKELIYDKKYKAGGVKKKIKEAQRGEISGNTKDIINLMKKELESILEIVNR
ncbi:MAG: MerR family transcriptional regulator [Candidatus Omnitrophica bacterium]|nr:MerR family transcriptional regulator [Candidatus Omnitrophota bacterium]MBU1047486.1 MerR family transcriptional regulator [Candidatus Omnitrophota bacterium]MBU1631366.1 MerR family transcriptional regulator [Candidatus Omnitrophota bacterium]MBU1767744.1 MerR family transcriptional regulator [Candidatus Omnitrophota bacterium]MBU1888849.1 MerR family transcriptional regulator [Candidatus Omnitrophota bacterium]